MSPERALLLTGTDEPQPERRSLQTGPLSVILEEGNLRAIRWHGVEAVRGISYLVRDENWGTYACKLESPTIEERADGFSVAYSGTCTSRGGATLHFKARIAAEAAGKLVFAVTAVPDQDFSTNRAGFNILHPIVGVAGAPATIEHVDGRTQKAPFPRSIDPAQPFLTMRAITHEVMPSVEATVRMEGDTFEMEDQRNWSDASFKTYVRPLALPWPYVLPANEAVVQTITVSFAGIPSNKPSASASSEASVIKVDPSSGKSAPLFGLNITPEEADATLAALEPLRSIAPRHLIFSFDPLQGHDEQALERFRRLQEAHPVPVTLELTLPCKAEPAAELDLLARQVAKAGLVLDALVVVPAPDLKSTPPGSAWPPCPPLSEVYSAARSAFPELRLGGGMLTYFTELNRKRVPADQLDFVTHTTAPLVHAADDLSVMQTLEALPFITASVREVYGDKPYRIGPSSIGMRHNPYGSGLALSDGRTRRTMVAGDPRQRSLFAAAWMVGYAAAVADADLEALTLGALTGPFGVLNSDHAHRPAFHAARALASLSGKPRRPVASSDPTSVIGLAAGNMLVLANLTDEQVSLSLPPANNVQVLDENNAEVAQHSDTLPARPIKGNELRLGAYGIAFCHLAGDA
ncbi:hypothetical protein [Tianweitania sediminis]|uniref:Uncharacterized protein n=1 Tax=Tianweitania sediminis TaxID=1502156 RepID=A0A8J7R0E6_9HYPH|nr:hypothetical protein [Tianweitania sediminis]MBP0438283.1 hypothetical protein [Tianweitania sediminis]